MNAFDFLDPSKESNEWINVKGRIFISDLKGFAEALSILISQEYADDDLEMMEHIMEPGEDPWAYIEREAYRLPLPSELQGNELVPVSDKDDLETLTDWDDAMDTFMNHFGKFLDWRYSYLIRSSDEYGAELITNNETIELLIPQDDEIAELTYLLYKYLPQEEAARLINSKCGILKLAAMHKLK